MSEAYNPETKIYERLEALEVEARELVQKRDKAPEGDHRKILDRQLKEIENEIALLRKRLKP